jgi:hypothetical protein
VSCKTLNAEVFVNFDYHTDRIVHIAVLILSTYENDMMGGPGAVDCKV